MAGADLRHYLSRAISAGLVGYSAAMCASVKYPPQGWLAHSPTLKRAGFDLLIPISTVSCLGVLRWVTPTFDFYAFAH